MNSTRRYNPLEMPHELSPELAAYYNDRRLMWRNVVWFMLLNVGWSFCFTVVGPLMTLRLNSKEIGLGESMIGMINSINGYAVSFLVMYFSWKSDHTVSRWGRRIPFLWISAPPIILSVVLFPYVSTVWMLLGVYLMQMFFMDMKNSTISLLPIDLVPRGAMARMGAVQGIVLSLVGFLVLRYGMRLSEWSETLPYLIGAGVMAVTTFAAGLALREPPIKAPATEPFRPWSTLAVGWRDRRMILLMLSVPLLGAPLTLYNMWVWLFAKNTLGLDRSEMGDALSWASLLGLALSMPCAWLIDRVSPFRLAWISLVMNVFFLVALLRAHDARSLIVVAFMFVLSAGLSGAASMLVFRSAHPAEVGSITSSLAFINNVFNATLGLFSGQLIERLGHNYHAAFILGMILNVVGFAVLLWYGKLMSRTPAVAASAPNAAPAVAEPVAGSP